jgi:teichuronic acid exporter
MAESLKDKTVHGLFWSSVERFSTQGVSFVVALILARLLSPKEFGVIAMLTIFIAISQTFIDSGFSSALVRKPDRTETDNSTAFYFNIVVGLVVYFLMFLASPCIANFYHTSILKPLTRFVALSLIFNSLCVVQQALFTIKIDFKKQAKISLLSALLSGIIGIIMAYEGYGVWALATQQVSASFFRLIFFWLFSKWRPKEKFSKQSFKELFSFGSKLLASGLIDTTYNNLYSIIIGKIFNASNLGLYNRADQFAQLPSSNLTGILQRVTFPVLSKIQDDNKKLRDNYRKILRLSAFVIFPLMTLLAAIANPLVKILLTDKWSGCIMFLQIICFSYMWYPIHAINLNLLQVKGRSDLFLKLEIIKKIIGTIILIIAIPFGLTAMCISSIISSLICLFINTYYTGKLINVGFIKQMEDIFPILINSLMVFVIAYIPTIIFSSNIIKLSLGLGCGLLFYIICSFIFKSNELTYIYNILKDNKNEYTKHYRRTI